ncbi:MAG: CDP-alcohol phosphatidyltransferase family protein [Phycisphaerales bacterium]|nr:MAG: CDP-alcohol phosphatidyltransferase family protein [Phycisphaerales bacterium]
MNEVPPKSAGFLALRRSGCRRGPSVVIGTAATKLRKVAASGLISLGVTPNMLSVAGFVLTGCGAVCLLLGAGHAAPWEVRIAPTSASWWPLMGAILLTVAGASDLLDGEVARLGDLGTSFGAVLDSTLDRFSDFLIFAGCAVHFSFAGNVTYVTLSLAAAANAVLTSYVKARAENFVDDCSVGYWQRGERCGLFLAAAYTGHIPAALWLLGTLPILTVIFRLRYAHTAVTGAKRGEPSGWVRHVMLWRRPRGSAGYDVCAGLVLGFVVIAPLLWPGFYGTGDPLRAILDRFVSV